MSHFVGTLLLELHIPEARSLKDKRSVIKSLIIKTRERFNASVAEVDHLDMWQRSEIAVAVVSGSRPEIDRVLEAVLNFIQLSFGGDLISIHKEVF